MAVACVLIVQSVPAEDMTNKEEEEIGKRYKIWVVTASHVRVTVILGQAILTQTGRIKFKIDSK
jgi:hypothetical protein